MKAKAGWVPWRLALTDAAFKGGPPVNALKEQGALLAAPVFSQAAMVYGAAFSRVPGRRGWDAFYKQLYPAGCLQLPAL